MTRAAVLRLMASVPAALALTVSAAWGQIPVSGTLHLVWDGRESGEAAHYVVDRLGQGTRLVTELSAGAVDELTPLDRKPVEILGYTEVPGVTGWRELRTSDVRSLAAPGPVMAASLVHESYDFVTVLCRFPEDEAVPFTRAQIEEVHGTSYPGIRNYFAELSWNPQIMSGSRVTQWYTLPQPRSAYVSIYGTDLGALARDCTTAAEQDVDFRDFFGINLQFSSGLSRRPVPPFDTLSFGGSWTLTLNGVSRSWGMTWLSAGHATAHVVLAHEMGHALGWPHSSGPYGSEYDSEWDVMSRGYARWEPPYGWLAIHTIGHHKDEAGWVRADRRWQPTWGTIESQKLARTALPPEHGYLLARIPLESGGSYTAEARRLAGQDRPLPGEAVVLHRVRFKHAFVVDVDGNGDPNDEGSQWQPGEEFHDSIAGFSLRVDSADATGFYVTITRGWRLDVAVSGPGRVIGLMGPRRIECDPSCTELTTWRGQSVTLEVAPAENAVFSHWEGACTGAKPCSLQLYGNRAAIAVFTPVFAIGARSLSKATMGAEYRDSVGVQGAPDHLTWSIGAGALPAGLQLDTATGAISGIPQEAGRFEFTLLVASGEEVRSRPEVLEVVRPVLEVSRVIDQLLTGRGLTVAEVRFLDFAGNCNDRLDVGDIRRWLEEGPIAGSEQGRLRQLLEGSR